MRTPQAARADGGLLLADILVVVCLTAFLVVPLGAIVMTHLLARIGIRLPDICAGISHLTAYSYGTETCAPY